MTVLPADATQAPSSTPVGNSSDPLLTPLRIKHLVLRNRLFSTSHACGLEEGGMPTERYQRYHEEKARGGIGLTMFGGSSNVAPDSPNVFRQLNVGVDDIIPHLQSFSSRIHAHGAALMCQITHLGRRGEPYAGNWLPTIAPSPSRETLHRGFAREMDAHDIERVVRAFGAAAERCEDGGLDGIETLAGGHLIGQFLSPKTNQRQDAFGGSTEARCRFGLMVFEEIRRRVSDRFLVGMRFVIDEADPEGLSFDESLRVAEIFERAGAVDFWNAIYGRMDTEIALAVDNMPGMASPIAPWLANVAAFKRHVSVPVFHAARLSDVATARHAIREGLLDLVGMTRAHIADPHIVRKLERREEERIRPCVGATHCQSQYRPTCLHNPATGRELQLPQIIARSAKPGRKIVVVGGGPAGLEAARVCAERGHEVVLFEAASRLGGQVLLAAKGSWRRDIIGIVDWRAAELDRLGVTVRLNIYADAADVRTESPDVVIIATGGLPGLDWLEGAEHCTNVFEVLSGDAALGGNVLVYDGTGRHPAPQVAELAHAQGQKVELVSLDAQLAQELTYAERAIWKRRLYERGIPTLFDHRLERVERRGNELMAILRNMLTNATVEQHAEQIVVEHGTLPLGDVFHSLRPASRNDGVTDLDRLIAGQPQPRGKTAGFELYRIGDALTSRNIQAATLDALRLCCVL
jgi:2,4-dienoyl-CoA reductase-like NADH-dependent reductase (Old Yellow Enzyme family)